jgi:hypothetical protein
MLVILYLRADQLVRKDKVMRGLCQGAVCMGFFIVGAGAFWPPPTSLADLMLSEPYQGAHRFTYLAIAVIFFLGFYYWRDPFRSALVAALYVTIHEGVYFIVFYGLQPWLLWADPLLGDRAYIIWMLTVLALYWKKNYWGLQTWGLWMALVTAVIGRVSQVFSFGLSEKPETILMAFALEGVWALVGFCVAVYVWDNRRLEPRW